MSRATLAKALRISPRQYRRHLRAAQAKLGARTRAHLVVLALLRGFVELKEIG